VIGFRWVQTKKRLNLAEKNTNSEIMIHYFQVALVKAIVETSIIAGLMIVLTYVISSDKLKNRIQTSYTDL